MQDNKNKNLHVLAKTNSKNLSLDFLRKFFKLRINLSTTVIKIIAGFLLLFQLGFFLFPLVASAQFSVVGDTPELPLYTVSIGNDTSAAATLTNGIFLSAYTAAKTAEQTCKTKFLAAEAANTAVSTGFSFSSLIGGGGALALQLGHEVAYTSVYLYCEQAVLLTLNSPPLVVTTNDSNNTLKQQLLSQVNANISSSSAKLKTALARYNVANQNIWKALLITILIQTTKSVADQLVTKLVNNYKISNIKAYTDSVATLMYDNQFIRDNFPDQQDQLMARAILTNPALKSQIQPGILAKANAAVGFTPTTANYATMNYSQMAQAGMGPGNPYLQQTMFVSGVNQAHSNAQNSAQVMIAQSNGYKTPVTSCNQALNQQKTIDTQNNAAQAKLNYDQRQLNDLQNALEAGVNVSQSDINKASAAVTADTAAWNNLPYTVAGNNSAAQSSSAGGSAIQGQTAIVMCEAVSSPAVLVNQGIDALFNAVGNNISQYNSSNLPGVLGQIASIATQIGSRMILGGITGTSAHINENQVANAGVAAITGVVIQNTTSNTTANMANGISLTYSSTDGVANGYSLNWTVQTTQIPVASYVTITGPGITGAATKLPLSGAYAVVSSTGGNYVLTVYDQYGKSLATATQNIAPPSQQSFNYNSGAPQVAGAFTNLPVVATRGPQLVFAPRGQ